ncbi:carbohydrate ABC transporter permease [Anaerosporobacter sp.]|uniref:carbohydrate ABC transporter permease n=1 Tax=Anaerosporobacter sp. TaxID=1872529 RepID=UPI00286F4F7F|nr:carbohydrate ABC transporter permease [Anaerosporobacter sp.]
MKTKAIRKHKEPIKAGDLIFNIINYSVFGIFTLACIFPFYYLFINTISNNDLVTAGQISFLPKGIHFGNYVNIMKLGDLMKSLVTTVSRTVIGTVLMVFGSALCGYLFTKQEMWHRKFIFRLVIITMYLNAGLIPWYLNMSMLGLTNNFMAYIIPTIVAPYNLILVKTYIESIPPALEESAQLDGATYWQRFTKVVLPLCKPILATIAIFGAVGHWNSFQDSLILMQSRPDLFTLQHRLYIYLNQASNLASTMQSGGTLSQADVASLMSMKVVKYTVAMVTVIPIMTFYPFMQKHFEKGIMLGAVKG